MPHSFKQIEIQSVVVCLYRACKAPLDRSSFVSLAAIHSCWPAAISAASTVALMTWVF